MRSRALAKKGSSPREWGAGRGERELGAHQGIIPT